MYRFTWEGGGGCTMSCRNWHHHAVPVVIGVSQRQWLDAWVHAVVIYSGIVRSLLSSHCGQGWLWSGVRWGHQGVKINYLGHGEPSMSHCHHCATLVLTSRVTSSSSSSYCVVLPSHCCCCHVTVEVVPAILLCCRHHRVILMASGDDSRRGDGGGGQGGDRDSKCIREW